MNLLDHAVDCKDSHVVNMKRYREVIWERRWMALACATALVSILIFIVAILLPDWAVIDFTNTNSEHVHIKLGIWGEYRTVNTSRRGAEWISHFPEPASGRYLRLAGVYLKHFYRAQAAFCIIGLVMMIFTNGMALYSFMHHRYMFKRLVAVLYFFTAMCTMMCIEILIKSIDEWNTEVAQKSYDSNWNYSAAKTDGKATYMARGVMIVYFIAAIIFAIGSRKQKGSRAATAEFEIEDRPVHCSRR
ncbi:Tat pathway signal sequence domain protein [Ditylenchus destructor]|uniref:Tat pathway signal sequence domain protein n=1 Tax=Ditylenchus destructor TaxID=166010 RepID=A0AAD4N505_9BILA|nr:Tat pathway signal sequence domain protein [Ditylenchus destructor]